MQMDLVQPRHPHGLESAQAHVQCDVDDLYTTFRNSLQDFRREVQAGRGRSHRATLCRVDCLIALAVGGVIGAMDIGWQRHVPDPLNFAVEVFDGGEAEKALAQLAAVQHLGPEQRAGIGFRSAELEMLAHADLFARPDQCPPLPRALLFRKQHFDASRRRLCGCACGDTAGEQASRQHAAIVQYQHVAAAQQVWKAAKLLIAPSAGTAIERQHAGGAALRGRFLCDQLFWKKEIEIGDKHAFLF